MTAVGSVQQQSSGWTGAHSVHVAWALWLVFAIGISITILRHPERTVTPNYRVAASAFLESRPLYAPGQNGWLYPIQSALVFIPFAFEPLPASEVLWRTVGIGALGVGVWRLTRRCGPRGGSRHDLFLLASCATIAPALGAARNGQANLLIAGLLVHACVDVIDRRWWRAAGWLGFSLAVKPIAIVVLLLYTALHRPLWWRMPVVLAVVAVAPFAHPNWSYVAEQYLAGLRKVAEATDIREFTAAFRPADLTSLLDLVGIPPGGMWLTAVRGLAAVGILALCFRAKALFDQTTAAVLALALGCGYLMVFNPRTEANSYAIFGPALAILAAWSLLHDRRSRRSIILVAACVVLGGAQLFVYRQREYWIRPAETMLILAWLSAAIAVPRWRRTIPTIPELENRGEPSARQS